MTLQEIRKWKNYLGFSNQMLSERSGVPVGTLQKILSGETRTPRYDTIIAIEKAILKGLSERAAGEDVEEKLRLLDLYETSEVHDSNLAYDIDFDHKFVRAEDVDNDARSGCWRRQGSYTIDDYYSLPGDVRAELIDGELYNLSAPTTTHQIVVQSIFTALFNYMMSLDKSERKCSPYISPIDVQLDRDDKTMVQPDVVVYCNDRGEDIRKRLIGAPSFVVEVISPSSRRNDLVRKPHKYMSAGVREYWAVDPEEQVIWVYDFEGDKFLLRYTFDESVPVNMTGGDLSIDFTQIRELLDELAV